MMEVIKANSSSDIKLNKTSIALGTFDGVHLGHQQIIKEAVLRAKECSLQSMIYTFDPHPLQVICPGSGPSLITSLQERIELLKEFEPDYIYVQHFTPAFAALDYREFVVNYLVKSFGAQQLVVGEDFSFGHQGHGDISSLQKLASDYGFNVTAQETVCIDGQRVKSTIIRRLIGEGRMERASSFLGRYFSLSGEVVSGSGRGRGIGYPTANINPPEEIVSPARGVYAVMVDLEGKVFPGVANLGCRPTFNDSSLSMEVHLLDYQGDLYRRELQVEFISYLRPEISFSSPERLKERIGRDIISARRTLEERSLISPGA